TRVTPAPTSWRAGPPGGTTGVGVYPSGHQRDDRPVPRPAGPRLGGGRLAADPPGAEQRQCQHGGTEGSGVGAVAAVSAGALDAAPRCLVEPDGAVPEWVSSRRAVEQLVRDPRLGR